ncbi:hypothetical protein [Mycobacterium sp. 852002-51057_SCH5723018]|uniref:hypothetical protein n=1 Tax=Mycobacterium sp. 852002-51057_SCH5723018 TaxID=1834094 RepID=UPI000800F68E|nr:hypothetical protein [Mycobacterium sp. 852002-51057_SCH5723018]OBG20364.1 hypothetical protein A5764_15505 [Mycobacterium sp. 852002-51057_SCH5723018]
MGRKVAIPWHALFSIAAGFLYFFFVLPRWPELMGDTTHSLGTTLRIVTGALVGLAALPVVFTQLRTRKPELGTPQLALTIRVWSIVAHVLAGVLIVGTAISEIWFSLDAAGRWLFAIYGAAAAIGVLGFFAFYLSFVAELPPPPPKPIKAKKPKRRRLRRKNADEATAEETEDAEAEDAEATEAEDTEAAEAEESEDAGEPETEEAQEPEQEEEPTETAVEPVAEAEPVAKEAEQTPEEQDTKAAEEAGGGLRNRRPTGKGSHRMRRRRTRGGVALDE